MKELYQLMDLKQGFLCILLRYVFLLPFRSLFFVLSWVPWTLAADSWTNFTNSLGCLSGVSSQCLNILDNLYWFFGLGLRQSSIVWLLTIHKAIYALRCRLLSDVPLHDYGQVSIFFHWFFFRFHWLWRFNRFWSSRCSSKLSKIIRIRTISFKNIHMAEFNFTTRFWHVKFLLFNKFNADCSLLSWQDFCFSVNAPKQSPTKFDLLIEFYYWESIRIMRKTTTEILNSLSRKFRVLSYGVFLTWELSKYFRPFHYQGGYKVTFW